MAKPSKEIVAKSGKQRTKVGPKVGTDPCNCSDPCASEAGGGIFTCEDGVMTYIDPPSGPGLWVLVKSSNIALPYWITVQQLIAAAGNQAMPAQSVMRSKSKPKPSRRGKR